MDTKGLSASDSSEVVAVVSAIATLIGRLVDVHVAAERERCAKLAEAKHAEWQKKSDGESINASIMYDGMASGAYGIAEAIRRQP